MRLTHRARQITVVICALGVFSPAIAAAAATAPSPPAPPANVVAVTGNALAKVSWTEVTAKTSFTASAVAAGHVTRTCKVKVDLCTITSLANGVTYSVSVTATNAKGVTSAASAAATVTVGVPGPPRTVQTTPAKVLVIVKWLAPLATGVAAITGYAATAMPGGFTCLTVSSLLAPAARSCTIVGLTKVSTYTITVTAHNRWGSSVPSKGVTVTTR